MHGEESKQGCDMSRFIFLKDHPGSGPHESFPFLCVRKFCNMMSGKITLGVVRRTDLREAGGVARGPARSPQVLSR